MKRVAACVLLLLTGCARPPFAVYDYQGRCGDPPTGTAIRAFGCTLRMDDAASGGDWHFFC